MMKHDSSYKYKEHNVYNFKHMLKKEPWFLNLSSCNLKQEQIITNHNNHFDLN